MNMDNDAMLLIKKTNSSDPDFVALVESLDADLAQRDGEDHTYYAQFNKIDLLKHAVVGYQDDKPVACGAIKEFDSESTEVKRMYVLPEQRGHGHASAILNELERWASELGYHKCVLETGMRQPEAIRLYTKNGYARIANYGPYKGIENSLCFRKSLT